jgi:hypothetical protein
MFIIGATGQIITLILTVILPMLMLVPRHPKVEVITSYPKLEIHQSHNNPLVNILQTADFSDDIRVKKQLLPVVFNNQGNLNDTAQNKKVKWKTFYLHDSGNKAPPSFL